MAAPRTSHSLITMAGLPAAGNATMAAEVSANKFLQLGLELFGYKRWRRYKYDANLQRFSGLFGVLPSTVERVWHLLRHSTNEEARLPVNANPLHLLLAISHLWNYQTEPNHSKDFKMTAKTARKWKWDYVRRLAALMPTIVRPYLLWLTDYIISAGGGQSSPCPLFLRFIYRSALLKKMMMV